MSSRTASPLTTGGGSAKPAPRSGRRRIPVGGSRAAIRYLKPVEDALQATELELRGFRRLGLSLWACLALWFRSTSALLV